MSKTLMVALNFRRGWPTIIINKVNFENIYLLSIALAILLGVYDLALFILGKEVRVLNPNQKRVFFIIRKF